MPYLSSSRSPQRSAIEEAERALEDRADLVARLEHIDRDLSISSFSRSASEDLPPPTGPEQIEDLLALLQALRRVPEEADDPLDRLFHAVEVVERPVALDGAVEEDAAQARVLRGVDQLRLADRRDHPLGGGGVHHRVVAAPEQVILQQHLVDLRAVILLREPGEDVHQGPFPALELLRCLAFSSLTVWLTNSVKERFRHPGSHRPQR